MLKSAKKNNANSLYMTKSSSSSYGNLDSLTNPANGESGEMPNGGGYKKYSSNKTGGKNYNNNNLGGAASQQQHQQAGKPPKSNNYSSSSSSSSRSTASRFNKTLTNESDSTLTPSSSTLTSGGGASGNSLDTPTNSMSLASLSPSSSVCLPCFLFWNNLRFEGVNYLVLTELI